MTANRGLLAMAAWVVFAASVASVLGQAPTPSDADWTWLERHRERALEALMPVTSRPKQVVAYRRYRDLYQDEHEAYFAISVADGPAFSPATFRATLIVPVNRSVQQQLLQLHMRDRQASLESLLPRVSVRRLDFTEDRCPSIRARVDALSQVSMSLSDPNVIVLHPEMHRLVINIGGEHVDATLIDSESSAVRWAADTVKALQACAG